MKKTFLLVGLLFFALLYVCPVMAQNSAQSTNVTVVYNNSLPNALFENVTRFYFDNGDLVLDQNGVTSNIPVTTIQRLELDAVSSVQSWEDNSILLYPNPTSDKLYFSTNKEQIVQVRVYSMNGQLLFSQQLSTSESIDVSTLSKGMYIIKINNQTYKFSKL